MNTKEMIAKDGYEIYRDGRIFNLNYNNTNERKELTPYSTGNGYLQVRIKGKPTLVHRLIAGLFIPNYLRKMQVNHIDGDKTNNHADNLEWVTASENCQHAHDTGLSKSTDKHKEAVRKAAKKVGQANRKISDEQRFMIEQIYVPKDKQFGAKALAEAFNVSPQTIMNIANRSGYYGH